MTQTGTYPWLKTFSEWALFIGLGSILLPIGIIFYLFLVAVAFHSQGAIDIAMLIFEIWTKLVVIAIPLATVGFYFYEPEKVCHA